MHSVSEKPSGDAERNGRHSLDAEERERILNSVYQSPVYREFVRQWGQAGVLKQYDRQ